MKIYPITNSLTETIDFRASDNQYALVRKSQDGVYDTIILNEREILALHQAIQEEINANVHPY